MQYKYIISLALPHFLQTPLKSSLIKAELYLQCFTTICTSKHHHFTSSQPQLCCLRSAAKVSNATEQMQLPRALPRLLPISRPCSAQYYCQLFHCAKTTDEGSIGAEISCCVLHWPVENPPPSSVSHPHVCITHILRLLQFWVDMKSH